MHSISRRSLRQPYQWGFILLSPFGKKKTFLVLYFIKSEAPNGWFISCCLQVIWYHSWCTCRLCKSLNLIADQLYFFLLHLMGFFVNIKLLSISLSRRPTFFKIYKRKTSEGYQALPYSVGLLCASLFLYYALLQSGKFLILSINTIGSTIQATYLVLFIIYSPRAGKVTALYLSLAYIYIYIASVFNFF